MSSVIVTSNYWKYQLGKKLVDISADTFKIILMDISFVFDRAVHATLADVIASPSLELPTDHGYTQQTKELAGGAWAQDDAVNKGIRTFDTVSWQASGGDIGPFGSAIIYDDSTGSASPLVSPTVVGCIDLGAEYTIPDGSIFQITSPVISNS
jgi:hypothetical protein